jgi:mitochondrial fission protein ELM1
VDLKPLLVWAASDGRAGIEAQALGLAEAVARRRSAHVEVKRIAWKGGVGRLPAWMNLAPSLALERRSAIAPPWPDIWIATGRATLPISTRLKRWSNGHTFVVQTQDPRAGLSPFDLVIPPTHDGLAGANVFPIVGAPNRLTPTRLENGLERIASRLAALPRPLTTLIVGGRSKAHDLPKGHAAALADEIASAVRASGGSLLVSFTRRTPPEAEQAMRERLSGLPGWIWDGHGDNPYFGFLAAADAILVTEDSTNLATDAAATGKPVHVLKMAGHSAKFDAFHAELRRLGVERPFAGKIDDWSYTPLAETDRAAAEILRLYDLKA